MEVARTPLWIGAFLMAWATALGPIISRQPRQSSRFDPAHYPLLANILLILTPSLFVASIVPLSWVLGRTFDKCFAMFLALDSRLVQAGINYEQGPFMDSTGLEMMVVQLKAQSDDVSMAWRNTWLVWCSYIVILFAVRPSRPSPNRTHMIALSSSPTPASLSTTTSARNSTLSKLDLQDLPTRPNDVLSHLRTDRSSSLS